MNPKVDFYFNKDTKWDVEIKLLRNIILDCGLTEELKWGCPSYLFENKNIVLIHIFKEYCAVLFFKGALLKDPKKILIQQTINVQVPRQIRFTNINAIEKQKATLKAYIKEAIAIEKSGVKMETEKQETLLYPEEFQQKMKSNPALQNAFHHLTPGRQRAYNLFFSQPKQSTTRTSRIDKCIPQILMGKGLND